MADYFGPVRSGVAKVVSAIAEASVQSAAKLCQSPKSGSPVVARILAQGVLDASMSMADVVARHGTLEDRKTLESAVDSSRAIIRESVECGVSGDDSVQAVEQAQQKKSVLLEEAIDVVRAASTIEGTMMAPIGMWID